MKGWVRKSNEHWDNVALLSGSSDRCSVYVPGLKMTLNYANNK